MRLPSTKYEMTYQGKYLESTNPLKKLPKIPRIRTIFKREKSSHQRNENFETSSTIETTKYYMYTLTQIVITHQALLHAKTKC